MHTEMIPVKTRAGLAELTAQQRQVSQRHRTLLHLVDGRRGEEQVRRMAGQAGVPPSCFVELLTLGLIEMREATTPARGPSSARLAAADSARNSSPESSSPDSELPASRTLPPTSGFLDSLTGEPVPPSSWFQTDPIESRFEDDAMEQARDILLRTLRAEAPLVGSLTALRLRRARSRQDLRPLVQEVEARIGDRHRNPDTRLALQQARALLDRPPAKAAASPR